MTRWFRFYDDAINDPKILKLSDKLHRVWIAILCAASKNNGELLPLEDLALVVRMKPEKLRVALESLANSGLIDNDGAVSKPHNWDKRQFKSDVSTDRVKRFRNVSSAVSETPPETEQKQITEKNISTVAKATRRDPLFDEFWKVYPKRDGANPKAPAEKLFLALIKSGIDPIAIIDGARRCGEREIKNVGTPFIPQAVKWLRDKRWLDYGLDAEIIKFDVRKHLI